MAGIYAVGEKVILHVNNADFEVEIVQKRWIDGYRGNWYLVKLPQEEGYLACYDSDDYITGRVLTKS